MDFADGAFVEYDRKAYAMIIGGDIAGLTFTNRAHVLVQTQTSSVKARDILTLDSPETIATGNLTVQK
ncbi:MAG TPA: hypothetical protein ACHBX0_07460 [Arsenophonus sp.]